MSIMERKIRRAKKARENALLKQRATGLFLIFASIMLLWLDNDITGLVCLSPLYLPAILAKEPIINDENEVKKR